MLPSQQNVESVLLAIIQSKDVDEAIGALNRAGLQVTRISSTGGFFQAGNVSLMLGLANADIARAQQLLAANCHQRTIFVNAAPQINDIFGTVFIAPTEAKVGGATIFTIPVERYIRLGTEDRIADSPISTAKAGTMKLILAIVPEAQAPGILDGLTRAGYRATRISTTGGFLRRGNATILTGIETNQLEDALARIREVCRTYTISDSVESCATIFVLDVAHYERV